MPVKSAYRILGIPEGANADDIKNAYRIMALKWHPDRHHNSHDKDAATRHFLEVTEAYRTLVREGRVQPPVSRTQREPPPPRRRPPPMGHKNSSESSISVESFVHMVASGSTDTLPTPASSKRESLRSSWNHSTRKPGDAMPPQFQNARPHVFSYQPPPRGTAKGPAVYTPPAAFAPVPPVPPPTKVPNARPPPVHPNSHAYPAAPAPHTTRPPPAHTNPLSAYPAPPPPKTARPPPANANAPNAYPPHPPPNAARPPPANANPPNAYPSHAPNTIRPPPANTNPPNAYPTHPLPPKSTRPAPTNVNPSSAYPAPPPPKSTRLPPAHANPPNAYPAPAPRTTRPPPANSNVRTAYPPVPPPPQTNHRQPPNIPPMNAPGPGRPMGPDYNPPHAPRVPPHNPPPNPRNPVAPYDIPLHSLGPGSEGEWVYALALSLEDIFLGKHFSFGITRAYLSSKTKLKHVVIEIDIPAGCRAGTRILCRNVGHERKPGVYQDIAFIIDEVPHARFVRDGDDLYMEVRLPWVDGLRRQGGRVPFTGIDGRNLGVQIDYQTDKSMTGRSVVKGAGMPIRERGQVVGRGNLIVQWQILPPQPRMMNFMRRLWGGR